MWAGYVFRVGNGVSFEHPMEQLFNLEQQLTAQIDITIKPRPHLNSKRQRTLI